MYFLYIFIAAALLVAFRRSRKLCDLLAASIIAFAVLARTFAPDIEPFSYANKEMDGAQELSFQKPSLYDQEYIDPDDGKPKVKRFINETIKIWDQSTIDAYLKLQNKLNPDVIFDMDIIQQQVSEEDAKEFVENRKWAWSDRTKEIYADVMSRNNFLKRSPTKSMMGDQTIYNEDAMLRILGLNEDEGKFLMFGRRTRNEGVISDYNGRGTYGISSGLVHPDIYSASIKCNKGRLQRQHFTGYNKGLSGHAMFETTDIDPKDLPELYKGFQYINEPCNPCVGLEFPYNNTCAFSIKPDKKVSPAWEKIWGLPPTPIRKMPKEFPFWIN